MAVLPVLPPRIVGVPGLDSPNFGAVFLAQAAAIREGDFVTLNTTGSITTPAPTGSMATTAGPVVGQDFNLSSASSTFTVGNVTVAGAASAGAPAASYYVLLTYTATSNESLPTAEFIVNCAFGVVPTFNVTATGAPAAATNYAVYEGIYSGGEALQQATKTTTALGSTFTTAYPLTNNFGANRAATNANANIAGIAIHDSAAIYVDGVGGSFTANIGTPLGTWMPPPPLGPADPMEQLVVKLTGNVPIEICLKQAYYPSLIGSTAGLLIDPTSGYFVLDTTQSNKPFTIIDKSPNAVAVDGYPGDSYARVKAFATSGVI